VVEMEEMRITARPNGEGDFSFESYDAEMLFREGTERLEEGQCREAVRRYERLVEEFRASRFVSPALYNAGLCEQQKGRYERAAVHYERLVELRPESPDVKDARFQLAKVYLELERWSDVLRVADTLLAREDLGPDQRVEGMARRAQALLGRERLEDAARQAESALSFARRREGGQEAVRDSYFLAAANFVLAETLRLQAAAVDIPRAEVEAQRAILEKRARLILDAQREYFNTIRRTDAHWAAASGYQIGRMYDALWEAIMSAPVPPPNKPLPEAHLPIYREEYRKELARLVQPLVRHSIRYWELTLMMIERTGVETEWQGKIRDDLARARERLLSSSAGPDGEEVGDAPDEPGAAEEAAGPRSATPDAPPTGSPEASAPRHAAGRETAREAGEAASEGAGGARETASSPPDPHP
jgi:tetratricopeptide (TPR) repeat protein